MKVRADVLVQQRGLAESRTRAQALILAGSVIAGDHRVDKPGQLLDSAVELRVKEQLPYVSRGGLKLEKALDHFGLGSPMCCCNVVRFGCTRWTSVTGSSIPGCVRTRAWWCTSG